MFLFLFAISIASAESNDVDYVDVKKGEVAKFDGKLFTNEAIAKILANHKAEKEKMDIESQYRYDKLQSDLDLRYSILEAKRKSEIKMYTSMIDTRDEYIKRSQKKDTLQKWAAYGSFILGAATSVAIFYSVQHD